MKVIFAESGQGVIIDNDSCPMLSSLKNYLHITTNIPIDQQILLTSSGTQLRDANYSPTHSTEIFILFNRQHLERNTTTGDSNTTTLNNDHREENPWFKSMVESRIPSTIDSTQLDQLRTSFTALVNECKDERTQPHNQQWSQLNYTEFYQRFIKTIQQALQEIANLASQHGIMADTMTQELKMQAIALNAALSNLDNHIKTTYDHQNKFDRIAKRELGKHTRWIQLVDMDLSFMHELKLHPQIQTQIDIRPGTSSCLIDCFSTTPLDSARARLQKDYDRLHRKTNTVHERMDTIYQQSTNINVQRTGSDAVVNKVTLILGEIQTYLSFIDAIWLHFEQRWKKRDMDSSFGAADHMMEGVIDKQDGGDGNNIGETTSDTTITSPSTNAEQQQTDIINNNDRMEMELDGSGEQGNRSNDNNNNNNNNNNNLGDTMKKTDLNDLSDETLTRRLFLYESLIRHSLETIMNEKRNAMKNFFQCLQTISTLEESIANLFLSLRHLGTDIKQLGQRTGQLETVSKGIIEGYGMMLIELWRRNQYYQIISKNAELLNGLFSTFASSEQQYRDKFQTDICMIDGLDTLLYDNTMIKDEMCIIPFIWQEFTNDDRCCTAIPALDITLLPNHRHQPSDNNNNNKNNNGSSSSNNNNNNNKKAIPFESSLLICKKDIDEFIDLMQSYYTTFKGDQGQTNDKATRTTMVQRLSEKFDRESKRLTKGLTKLGLPSNKAKKESFDVKFSSSSASSPSNTSSISTALPTSSSATSTTMQVQPSPTYNLPFVPSLSKREWGSSSIYAQVQQQQDLKSKINALEQELKRDHQLFEKQRSILLEEIKMKDNQIHEKEQQWESQWSAKLQEIQQQLELEQKAHENDILEWKAKYQEAMDTEQQKHYRRLAYFHERLVAKNAEYAELELQLTHSAPSSPVQETHRTSFADASSLNDGGVTGSSSLHAEYTNLDTKLHVGQVPYRWRRSASLDAATLIDPFSKRIQTPVAQTGRLKLATVRQPISKKPRQQGGSSTAISLKDDLYARELQDLTLRHQASVDNMVSEYEENRIELLAQHDREKEVWKIEHDAELQDACKKLAQEHESILNSIHQSWQQKWDDLVVQNKRDQVMQQQQWNQQLATEKRLWEENQAKEQAALNKQLSWSKGELHMVLKEHETATRLAKQLNLVIDHTTDVDDMKYTLLGLLETGIQNASRLDSQHYLTEKSSETASPFGFMNMSFF